MKKLVGEATPTVQVAQQPVQNLIKAHYKKIEELKEEIKTLSGMIDDELEKDNVLSEVTEQVKALAEERKELREKAIEKTSGLLEKMDKLKDLKRDLKDSRKALGSFCAEHYRETRQLTFADHLGNDHSFEFAVAYK